MGNVSEKNISEIDKNLAVETSISREGLRFYDSELAPFQIYGIYKDNGMFRRMPKEVAEQVSPGVLQLHSDAAGGRLRFVTDSPYVAIKAEYVPGKMPHFALTGSAGFDLYEEQNGESRYKGSFVPPFRVEDSYESVIDFCDSRERDITINFPLYSAVSKLYIGLKEGSSIKKAPEYYNRKPVVFYGSSITQGGCASRPGSSYQSILSRRLNLDYINLGFAGGAKAEDAMIEYIKSLNMSLFVYDYDYNAPSIEHLRATHNKMFRQIREAQPLLPIVIMSRPKYYLDETEKERLEIIYSTYAEAKASGDENVYFISGRELMELAKDEGTVDGCHPTDYGFHSMACAMEGLFREILK